MLKFQLCLWPIWWILIKFCKLMHWAYWQNGKNEVITFSRLFLIGSFSYLQVMRTYIKAYTSLNFKQIPPLTTDSCPWASKKSMSSRHLCWYWIFFKLAGNKNMHNIMNELFRPDRTTDYGVSCPWASKKYPYRPYNGKNGVSTFSLLFLIGSFWYFHVTRTNIKLGWVWIFWNENLGTLDFRCPLGYLFFNGAMALDWCQNFVSI